MSNEVVTYNNDMNTVALRKFNKTEMDIFIAICSKMKNKGLDIIEFDFHYLKELINWTDTNSKSFSKMLDSTYNKLIECNIKIGDNRVWTRFVLFTEYTIDLNKQTVTIGVNTKFKYILNAITSNFTNFELEEFLSFKSSYTKEFFRRMKQFKSTGVYKVSLEEFRRALDVPEKYKTSEIDKWVLKPILEELKSYKLTCNKIYKVQRVGRPKVDALEFKFSTKKFVSDEEFKERMNKVAELAVKEEENKAEAEELTLDKLNELYKNKSIIIFDKFANMNVKAYITSITRENDKIIINLYTETGKKIPLKTNSLVHASNYIKKKLKKYSVKENES